MAAAPAHFDPARLIFLDESGDKTNLTPLRGRAPRGQRPHASSPQGHWHTTTMICAMRLDASTAYMTIEVIEGATDAEVFRAYFPRVLCPTLRKGDVVIMDNLSPHKSEPTFSLIEQAGAEVLLLPAYSPDFNRIEQMWSKIQASLRSAPARTQPDLMSSDSSGLGDVSPQDAINGLPTVATALLKTLARDNYDTAKNLRLRWSQMDLGSTSGILGQRIAARFGFAAVAVGLSLPLPLDSIAECPKRALTSFVESG